MTMLATLENSRVANLKDAKKEIGLGLPPDAYGENCDMVLADQCSPQSRVVIAEVARWRVDFPILDEQIAKTFGNNINVWGTPDGQAPSGVTTATNTLATPGIFAADMILRGFSIRVLVEPEARLIRANFFNPGASSNIPGSPDCFTQLDVTNGALGLAGGQSTPTAAEVLYGMATWKSAFAFVNAYNLLVGKDYQDQLIREPLTQCAHIEPFATAEAAGLAFGSNQDRINELNQRLTTLGIANQLLPIFAKRLGSLTIAGPLIVSDFTPSREEDGSQTMFGGIGVPMGHLHHDPYLFSTPLFWPAGHPLSIEFQVNDPRYQASFQRWLSVTGGVGGQAGQDLNLQPSASIAAVAGYNSLSPSTTGAAIMLEQTLDVVPAPTNNTQQQNVSRALLKSGAMVIEVAAIGHRVSSPAWCPVVARAIKQGAISAPRGYGSLAAWMK
jgi:hypothetical protein